MINIPTISQLYSDIKSNLESEYDITLPWIGKNLLRAFAAVQAAKLKLFYLALGNIQKNIFVDTADPEASGGTLERFGRVKLGRNPFAAIAGQYQLEVTGSVGATIAAQSTFKSNDDSTSPGKLYVLDNTYTLVATTDYITVRALEAGEDSKLAVLDELTATAPIANVNSLVAVDSQIVQPLAAEDIEAYRTAAIEAYRLEPQGGAATDYILWSLDAQGVARSYPYAKTGAANEINLYVEATIADSTDGKGTPSGSLLTAVESVIELNPDTTLPSLQRGRRPLGVFQVHYLPVTIKQIDITIPGLVGRTTDIQTKISNQIIAAIANIRPFISGTDVLENKNDILDTNKIIGIIISTRPGSSFGTPIINVDSSPVSTYTFDEGNIPWVNSISFT